MRRNETLDIGSRWQIAGYRVAAVLRHIALAVWCFICLYPVVWVTLNAFRDNDQIYVNPFALPNPILLEAFPRVLKGAQLQIAFPNSLIYASVTVAVTLVLAAMTSFYLAKFPRKNGLLYTYFIIGIMVPVHALLIPLFVTMRNMGLLNSRLGILIVYVATNLSFSIFVLTGFMRKGIPDELLEAAAIDGYGPIRSFFAIALPLSQSGLATVGTFVFLGIWNEFLFALILLSKPALRTLNLTVYNLRGQYSSDQGLMSAGALVLIAPAILIYAIFQERVVKGLTAGAIKG